jgi:hypothetical protein
MFVEGQEEEALRIFRNVFYQERRWAELVPRLAKVGLFPDDPQKIKSVTALADRGRQGIRWR